MARMKALALIVFVVACSSSGEPGGGSNADVDASVNTPDAKEFLDAPSNVPAMLTLSGVTSERGLSGSSNTAGVSLAVFRTNNDATPLAMATSDAQGKYTLSVTTGGMAIDGYIKASKSGYVDIYLYPAQPWFANDTDGSINMMTPGNKDLLNNFAGGNQMAGKGMIGMAVFDSAGNPVAGATVSSMPASGSAKYNGSNGIPSSSATSTSADGVAFLFNVPENVTVTATKAGMTFRAHPVKARPDKFTTTSIAP